MIDFKHKRRLVIRSGGPISKILGNRVIRFTVAGFFALITTVLLFIFMDYLLGNFGKYSNDAVNKIFAVPLHIVKIDKKTLQKDEQAETSAPKQPKQPAKTKNTETPAEKLRQRRKEIEALLEKNVTKDQKNSKNSNTVAPE